MVKRTTVVEDDTVERAAEAAELAQLNADEDGAVFRISDELRQTAGVTAMIVCLSPAEKEGYVADMPIQEFSVARLKRLYGPGRYKIRLQGPKGFIPGGGTIKIADVVSDQQTVMPLDSERERRDKKAEERMDKLWEVALVALPALLTGLFNRPAPQGPDIAALITALKPAPGPSLADLSATLANMKALSAPPAQENTIDAALKIMERVSDMGEGKSGGGSNWLDVLRDVVKEAGPALKPVLDSIAARQQPVAAPIQATVVQPAAVAQIVEPALSQTDFVPNPTPQDTDMMNLFMPVIRQHLAKVAGWAEGNREPDMYADVFVDELPRELGQYVSHEQATEYLNHVQWFEYVSQVEPRLKNYRDWCDKFRLELIDIFANIPNAESPATDPEA